MYLSIRRTAIQIVVIIGAYHFYQLRTKLYQTSCCQGQLHMHRKLVGNINDFRPKGSVTDHIFCIRQILEKEWGKNERVRQLFIDFKKAYDSVRREVLCNILIEFCIPLSW